jgi:Ferritin-like domain
MKDFRVIAGRKASRRSFLKNGALAAGAVTAATGILSNSAFGAQPAESSLTEADIALLQFAAAAEIIESDLWQQYAELGGVTQGSQNNYQQALQFLDGDGSQYVTSNTLDEISHEVFLNAYLESKGADPVNLDAFRTLPSSQATGAQQIGRLTNLTQLNVDTSWFIRYRSTSNPDFGAKFPQAITITNRPAIPRNDSDFSDPNHIQAIANTAAFHFAFIEQGGSSLYHTFTGRATSLEVERILASIGGVETQHFGEWMDFSGNAVQGPPYSFTGAESPVTDAGLTFPNFNDLDNPLFQTNLIFPVACQFISPKLPLCSVIRPTPSQGIAMGAVKAFVADGLFTGQNPKFIQTLQTLAAAADAATRQC